MPKQKTYKALALRLKKAKGKILRLHGAHRHLLTKKSSRTKRQRKDKEEAISKADFKRIKKLI